MKLKKKTTTKPVAANKSFNLLNWVNRSERENAKHKSPPERLSRSVAALSDENISLTPNETSRSRDQWSWRLKSLFINLCQWKAAQLAAKLVGVTRSLIGF
jgi:hypothetical protein